MRIGKRLVIGYILLFAFVVIVGLLFAPTTRADYAPVVVNGSIVLNYDESIDVDHPINFDVDAANTQFNHDVNVNAVSRVSGNDNLGEVNVNTTAVGNAADIDLGDATSVQGIQESSISARSVIEYNVIPNNEVYSTTTAIGNQATLNGNTVSNTQFIYDSSVSAVNKVVGNDFGTVPLDPDLDTTAVGNAATLTGSDVDSYQLNRDVNIGARSVLKWNGGSVGPVNIDTRAIGNSVTIR